MHVHVNEFALSTHVAFVWQSCVPDAHSSTLIVTTAVPAAPMPFAQRNRYERDPVSVTCCAVGSHSRKVGVFPWKRTPSSASAAACA